MGSWPWRGKGFHPQTGAGYRWGVPEATDVGQTGRRGKTRSLKPSGTVPRKGDQSDMSRCGPWILLLRAYPSFLKGNKLSGTLRGRVTKFGEHRNQTHITLPRLNELHVSFVCKTELGTQCPMEPYQHVSLSYFRLVVLESTLAI